MEDTTGKQAAGSMAAVDVSEDRRVGQMNMQQEAGRVKVLLLSGDLRVGPRILR
jgi:hypothetical protein